MMAELSCDQCVSDKPREWGCLECIVHLHDFCIDKHIAARPQVTHSIIPTFDALTLDAVPLSVAPPRPDKVVITGIEPKGLIGHNKFMVETCGAGQGELSVKIHGRKGVYDVHMTSQEKRTSTVECSFHAKEAGEYTIDITWSGVRVPGAPFTFTLE